MEESIIGRWEVSPAVANQQVAALATGPAPASSSSVTLPDDRKSVFWSSC